MSKVSKHRCPVIVDLASNILVQTEISPENHAALRSGFAGYPANPRWNTTKYRAWRAGCQLRQSLAEGKMIVRSTDSLIVSVVREDGAEDDGLPFLWFSSMQTRQLAASY